MAGVLLTVQEKGAANVPCVMGHRTAKGVNDRNSYATPEVWHPLSCSGSTLKRSVSGQSLLADARTANVRPQTIPGVFRKRDDLVDFKGFFIFAVKIRSKDCGQKDVDPPPLILREWEVVFPLSEAGSPRL